MNWTALILVTLLCLGCGGLLPGKTVSKSSVPKAPNMSLEMAEQRAHLEVLHAKYIREGRGLNLAIVRGMILELEGKYPKLTHPKTLPDLKELRRNSSFLSLESTIEHLSHRESVKPGPRHSAYLNP